MNDTLYSVGEIAEECGVPVQRVRYWASVLGLKPAKRLPRMLLYAWADMVQIRARIRERAERANA